MTKTAQGDRVKKWPQTKNARDLAAEAYAALVSLYDKAEKVKTRNDKLSARPTVDTGRFPSLKGGR